MSTSQQAEILKPIGLPPARDLSDEFSKYIGKQVSYATHGIHRYPAKFIPQIPRFCIESYSHVGDTVLDPFMGSGTTLLEAYLSGRRSYGIDIHPLARLIARVKTTPLDPIVLRSLAENLLKEIEADNIDNDGWIPEIPNRDHWFRQSVLSELATIKKHIWRLSNNAYRDFFKICFSSIIRKVSNSDDHSLIPEVTSFQKKLDEQGKTSYDVMAKFKNAVNTRLLDSSVLWNMSREVEKKFRDPPTVNLIGRDARDIDLKRSSVDLAVTSPPYASAVHYVSVHKLEMIWLDILNDVPDLEGKVVGTSRAYASEYGSWEPSTRHDRLKLVLQQLMARDRKSAFVVYRYFDGMRRNFEEVNRVLKKHAKYCVVAGENTFKRVRIPTYSILADIASESGFEVGDMFVYDVINRHLDIPRWNDSRIEKDHILVLERTGVPSARRL